MVRQEPQVWPAIGLQDRMLRRAQAHTPAGWPQGTPAMPSLSQGSTAVSERQVGCCCPQLLWDRWTRLKTRRVPAVLSQRCWGPRPSWGRDMHHPQTQRENKISRTEVSMYTRSLGGRLPGRPDCQVGGRSRQQQVQLAWAGSPGVR